MEGAMRISLGDIGTHVEYGSKLRLLNEFLSSRGKGAQAGAEIRTNGPKKRVNFGEPRVECGVKFGRANERDRRGSRSVWVEWSRTEYFVRGSSDSCKSVTNPKAEARA